MIVCIFQTKNKTFKGNLQTKKKTIRKHLTPYKRVNMDNKILLRKTKTIKQQLIYLPAIFCNNHFIGKILKT